MSTSTSSRAGLGTDTATGGGDRDLFDLNAVADSKAGAVTRDVITDFAHLADKIDLMGINADATVAGNQAYRWAGTAALAGPGEVGFFTSGGKTQHPRQHRSRRDSENRVKCEPTSRHCRN